MVRDYSILVKLLSVRNAGFCQFIKATANSFELKPIYRPTRTITIYRKRLQYFRFILLAGKNIKVHLISSDVPGSGPRLSTPQNDTLEKARLVGH